MIFARPRAFKIYWKVYMVFYLFGWWILESGNKSPAATLDYLVWILMVASLDRARE